MHFVALDLETTGLSPETDTIIEVAAIRFEIERDHTGIYRTKETEERSMLIDPERKMTEEISMITGITDTMLTGKPLWSDIQERVREFIGTECVIVGHNVLFDIAMLRAHSIDLSHYPIIDTFELSEILSQEAESLNLGYLAGKYHLSAGDKEHRALGDTRLSVELFIHYLNQANTLEDSKKSILQLISNCEEVKNIGLFTEILGWQKDCIAIPVILTNDLTSVSIGGDQNETGDEYRYTSTTPHHRDTHSILLSHDSKGQETPTPLSKPPTSYSFTSLPLGRESERVFLRENIKRGEPTNIGVFGYMQTEYIKNLLEKLNYRCELYHTPEEYCSIDELKIRINQGNWKRKESILIAKILFWLENTKTGLIKELKLYGEERKEIDFFRMQSGEINPYYTRLEESFDIADVVIYDMSKHIQNIYSTRSSVKFVLKDITLLEEAMRRQLSLNISIESLIQALGELSNTKRLIEIIRFIEALYLGFPIRPVGPDVSPPGGQSETYFLTQSEIWYRGGINLSLINTTLSNEYYKWRSEKIGQNRRENILIKTIERSIEGLLQFHKIQNTTRGAIIEIENNSLSIKIIPRSVQEEVTDLLSSYSNIVIYGTSLGGMIIHNFLKNELGIKVTPADTEDIYKEKFLLMSPLKTSELSKSGDIGGTVILTTSIKHIREIGKSLKKTGKKILMQGISGGKGKQLGIFRSNPENAILIGTIDMWREELELWSYAKNIILAKLPFDPPTDSYFLARTVGMKNNFTLYSEPMVIIKINTLLSRIYNSSYNGYVYCEDIRLSETLWGKELATEIV